MKTLSVFSLLACLALGFAPATAFAGAKKQSAAVVRFYGEGGTEGGGFAKPITLKSGRETAMQTMALITENDIVSYHPFGAQDGSGTFGAYFKVDNHGHNLVSQHTLSRRGTYLLAFVNGRHVIDLFIDRGVSDGILCIPSGLTANEMVLLEQTFPRFGQEGRKPVAKKTAPKAEKVSTPPTATPEKAAP